MAQNYKREERKIQIKEVAIKLMSDYSYKDISIQKILDELNYSKSGFYNCYDSKAELFIDILKDGMEHRFEKITETKLGIEDKDKDKNAFLVETLLDKILDYNKYKKLFVSLMVDIPNDKELYDFYHKGSDGFKNKFFQFCDLYGLTKFKPLVNDEFNVLINTLIIGTEIFDQYDNEKYRELLKKIFKAYFNQIDLLGE